MIILLVFCCVISIKTHSCDFENKFFELPLETRSLIYSHCSPASVTSIADNANTYQELALIAYNYWYFPACMDFIVRHEINAIRNRAQTLPTITTNNWAQDFTSYQYIKRIKEYKRKEEKEFKQAFQRLFEQRARIILPTIEWSAQYRPFVVFPYKKTYFDIPKLPGDKPIAIKLSKVPYYIYNNKHAENYEDNKNYTEKKFKHWENLQESFWDEFQSSLIASVVIGNPGEKFMIYGDYNNGNILAGISIQHNNSIMEKERQIIIHLKEGNKMWYLFPQANKMTIAQILVLQHFLSLLNLPIHHAKNLTLRTCPWTSPYRNFIRKWQWVTTNKDSELNNRLLPIFKENLPGLSKIEFIWYHRYTIGVPSILLALTIMLPLYISIKITLYIFNAFIALRLYQLNRREFATIASPEVSHGPQSLKLYEKIELSF